MFARARDMCRCIARGLTVFKLAWEPSDPCVTEIQKARINKSVIELKKDTTVAEEGARHCDVFGGKMEPILLAKA